MTKAKELRDMSDEQLEVTLRERTDHLFRLRFQSVTERVEAPSEISRARREIARIKTILHQRRLERQQQAAQAAKEAATTAAKGEKAQQQQKRQQDGDMK